MTSPHITNIVDTPPVCDCCERKVRERNSKPFLLGCDAMLCKDCWYWWYDEAWKNSDDIKKGVWEKHGEFGGEANLTAILMKRLESADLNKGAGI